jgi:hypothetical protein
LSHLFFDAWVVDPGLAGNLLHIGHSLEETFWVFEIDNLKFRLSIRKVVKRLKNQYLEHHDIIKSGACGVALPFKAKPPLNHGPKGIQLTTLSIVSNGTPILESLARR